MHFFSVNQIAQRYDVSTASVWRWVRLGKFPKPVKLGPNTTRWREDDIASWEAGK